MAVTYQDIRQNRPYQCAASFTLYTQQEDAGDDSVLKDLEEVAVEGENIGTGTSLTYSVAPNRSQAFSKLGTIVQSPRQVLPCSWPVLGNVLQLKIDGSGLPAAPPISRKTSLRVMPQADQRRIKSYQLRIGRMVAHAGGTQDAVDPQDRINHLESLQTSGARVSFIDEDGHAGTVKLRSGALTFAEIEDESNQLVLVATLQVIVMSMAGTGSSMTLDTVGGGALDSPLWKLD